MKTFNLFIAFTFLFLGTTQARLNVMKRSNMAALSTPNTKIIKRLTKDAVPFEILPTTVDGKTYNMIYITADEKSPAALAREAARLVREYNGLKLAYSNKFLNDMGAGGVYLADLHTIFVSAVTMLKDDLEDDVYKHELMHARVEIDSANPNTKIPFMGHLSSTKGAICDMPSKVDNFYLADGYYLDEVPAYLISLKYILKSTLRPHQTAEDLESTQSYFNDITAYFSENVECARRVTESTLKAIQENRMELVKATVNESNDKLIEMSRLKIKKNKFYDAKAEKSILNIIVSRDFIIKNTLMISPLYFLVTEAFKGRGLSEQQLMNKILETEEISRLFKSYQSRVEKLEKNLALLSGFTQEFAKIEHFKEGKVDKDQVHNSIKKIDELLAETVPAYHEK